MKTRAELLKTAAERLRMAKVDSPDLDARVLVKYALRLSDAELIAAQDECASPEGAVALESMVARRAAGEPVARILGHKEFWGLRFELSVDTLVPRPETETLVDAAIAAFGRAEPLRVLDLGTGTGCLLLAVLHEFPEASGLGLDLAEGAVATARRNAKASGLGDRAGFAISDWDAAAEGQFDLIVSNPPYIPRAEIEELQPEVRIHDPSLALDGGPDGLDAYRALADVAVRRLTPSGTMILELGQGQEADVAAIMAQAGLAVAGPARCDLAGIPRALVVGR